MEPVSSLLIGHVSGKLLDKMSDLFCIHVIERWSRFRAQQFLGQLCIEVGKEMKGEHSDSLEQVISKIFEDEYATEALFNAYRRVVLSRSKTFGPRAIAVLTARIIVEKRVADSTEETMMDILEELYDDELKELAEFICVHNEKAHDSANLEVLRSKNGDIKIAWDKKQLDSNWDSAYAVSISPLILTVSLGAWASKAESFGILSTEVIQGQWEYKEDCERHLHQDETIREFQWWVVIHSGFADLADIIFRISSDSPDAA
jgi:hypothetical protein